MAKKDKLLNLIEESAKFPTDPQSIKILERNIESGALENLTGLTLPTIPRYLVTYMNSQTRGKIRSATVVTITNQASFVNRVTVSFFKGFGTGSVGSCTFSIPPDYTVDFCSRNLPGEITVCNCVPNPELTFDEGRAIVSSTFPQIGVSARVVYTRGDEDEELLAITDSKIVVYGKGNAGD